MQAKTAILMTSVGLVAGSVGLLVGSEGLSANDAIPARRAEGNETAQAAESLAARDAEIFALRQQLGRLGGRAAQGVLVDYVRREQLDHVDRAVTALAQIDAVVARGEAQAILDRPDASTLHASALETLRQHAGRLDGR